MKMEITTAARRHGFSLLEVMIAIGVFFLAVFAILGLVSSSLGNARRLQRPLVDAGAVAFYDERGALLMSAAAPCPPRWHLTAAAAQ